MERRQGFKFVEGDQHENLLISFMSLMHMRVVNHEEQEQ